jgi:hypothetical protein
MAGSLGGRLWRVRRLEGLDRGRQVPEPSRTELEAWALDAKIKKVNEELRAAGVEPGEWRHTDLRMDLSLDEHIAELEKERGYDDDHREASRAA